MHHAADDERLPSEPKWVRMGSVDVFRWLPARRAVTPGHQPVNFGDELALEVVHGMLRDLGVPLAEGPPAPTEEADSGRTQEEGAPAPPRGPSARLLAVGSVLHFARPGDTVWGAGVNGKIDRPLPCLELDIRSVRGPLTRATLAEAGVDCPAVFGDPALLVPELMPELLELRERPRPLSIIPNLNDLESLAGRPWVVQPTEPFRDVIQAILESELVIASSLHGIVLAEAFGVPVRPLLSGVEHRFKYDDYAAGTDRAPFELAPTIEAALAMGPLPPLEWDTTPLRDAFPRDLWDPSPSRTT